MPNKYRPDKKRSILQNMWLTVDNQIELNDLFVWYLQNVQEATFNSYPGNYAILATSIKKFKKEEGALDDEGIKAEYLRTLYLKISRDKENLINFRCSKEKYFQILEYLKSKRYEPASVGASNFSTQIITEVVDDLSEIEDLIDQIQAFNNNAQYNIAENLIENSYRISYNLGTNYYTGLLLMEEARVKWFRDNDFVAANVSYAKSLRILETHSMLTTLAVAYHNYIGMKLQFKDYEGAEILIERFINQSSILKDNYFAAYAYHNKGRLFFAQSEYFKAIRVWRKAIKIALRAHLDLRIDFNIIEDFVAHMYESIGHSYYSLADIKNTTEYFLKASAKFRSPKYKRSISAALLIIVEMYIRGIYIQYKGWYKTLMRSREISKELSDYTLYSKSFVLESIILSRHGKFNDSIETLEKLLADRRTVKNLDKLDIITIFYQLGTCYLDVNNFTQSIKYFNKIVKVNGGVEIYNCKLDAYLWLIIISKQLKLRKKVDIFLQLFNDALDAMIEEDIEHTTKLLLLKRRCTLLSIQESSSEFFKLGQYLEQAFEEEKMVGYQINMLLDLFRNFYTKNDKVEALKCLEKSAKLSLEYDDYTIKIKINFYLAGYNILNSSKESAIEFYKKACILIERCQLQYNEEIKNLKLDVEAVLKPFI